MGLKEFIVIRKSVKAYMKDVVETTVNSITTTEMQRLYLDGVEADKIRGKNICLLDDVISTGESMRAMETLVQQAGANVVARAAVLAEGEAADRKDIIFLKKLPLFHVDEQGHHTELE
jgi:adenine phosphoribosyltransferase